MTNAGIKAVLKAAMEEDEKLSTAWRGFYLNVCLYIELVINALTLPNTFSGIYNIPILDWGGKFAGAGIVFCKGSYCCCGGHGIHRTSRFYAGRIPMEYCTAGERFRRWYALQAIHMASRGNRCADGHCLFHCYASDCNSGLAYTQPYLLQKAQASVPPLHHGRGGGRHQGRTARPRTTCPQTLPL